MPHILIIEDEPLIALEIQAILTEQGATSFDFAETEAAAFAAAMAFTPKLITSDVKLLSGTGPRAVEIIHRSLGDIPVLFITASPDSCKPCNPPGIIVEKPMRKGAIISAYRQLMGS